ncbi:MAG: hypothetical protein K0A94_01910 [Desulfuromonadales bacterium]|nr:hypothetical protein [Desulfuromonadales bacterium]
MRVIILLFLIFLTGCASRGTLVWQHSEGYGDQQLQQAQKECRQIAQREARYPYPYYYYGDSLFPFYRPFYYQDRHYYAEDWIWRDHFTQMRYQEELSRLYRVCMEAKGWRLVRLPPAGA